MIHGLTLHHPWPAAVVLFGKNVENRDWQPAYQKEIGLAERIGKWIAIHGGKPPKRGENAAWLEYLEQYKEMRELIKPGTEEHAALTGYAKGIRARHGRGLLPEDFIWPGIVAAAKLVEARTDAPGIWAMPGALHLVLADIVPVRPAIDQRGYRNFWPLSDEAKAALDKQMVRRLIEEQGYTEDEIDAAVAAWQGGSNGAV